MSEQERWGAGAADRHGSNLLVIVAQGHAELRSAIEWALRGLPGVQVIEDRRKNRRLLSRSELEPRDATPSGDPDLDHPTGAAPTLTISQAPGRAWPLPLWHRV